MTRTLLGGALLALLLTAAGTIPAEAGPRRHHRDRVEDRLDRREDRRDLREDRRDARFHGGWRDRREDIRDRREDRWDRRH